MLTINVLFVVYSIYPLLTFMDHQAQAVVTISTTLTLPDGLKTEVWGRGCVVSTGTQGRILTARHVVDLAMKTGARAKIKFKDGSESQSDRIVDLGVFDTAELYCAIPEGVKKLSIGPAPKVGDWVLVHRADHAYLYQVDLAQKCFFCCPEVVIKGDSGGHACNAAGEVVGVISGGWFILENTEKTVWPTLISQVK